MTPAALTRCFVLLMAAAMSLQVLDRGALLSNVLPLLVTAAAMVVGVRATVRTLEVRDEAHRNR